MTRKLLPLIWDIWSKEIRDEEKRKIFPYTTRAFLFIIRFLAAVITSLFNVLYVQMLIKINLISIFGCKLDFYYFCTLLKGDILSVLTLVIFFLSCHLFCVEKMLYHGGPNDWEMDWSISYLIFPVCWDSISCGRIFWSVVVCSELYSRMIQMKLLSISPLYASFAAMVSIISLLSVVDTFLITTFINVALSLNILILSVFFRMLMKSCCRTINESHKPDNTNFVAHKTGISTLLDFLVNKSFMFPL